MSEQELWDRRMQCWNEASRILDKVGGWMSPGDSRRFSALMRELDDLDQKLKMLRWRDLGPLMVVMHGE